jgi:hypothetical protein
MTATERVTSRWSIAFALGEVATGVALLVVPSLVGRWLFGLEFSNDAIVVARFSGIALVGLGVACWPPGRGRAGLMVYSALAASYLAFVGLSLGYTGILLWPAVALHAVMIAVLGRTVFW